MNYNKLIISSSLLLLRGGISTTIRGSILVREPIYKGTYNIILK
jgi:hypothetical protein